MKKILFVNVFILMFSFLSFSQNTNIQSIKSDSTPFPKESKTVKKVEKDKKYSSTDSFPVPKRAAMWSILPGGGQIYNKKLWYIKVPLVYGALGTTVYLTSFNQKLYRKFKAADFNLRNPVDPKNPKSGYSDIPNDANTTRLREIRDAYFKRTQQMYILTGVTYLLAAAEAFTSAHLAHFDVNDDLTFRLKPSFEPIATSGNAVGLGFQLKF